jgi:hypothetical protein
MAAGRAGSRLAIIGADLDGALWAARPRMSCCRSGVPTLEMVWRSRRRRPASRSRRPRTPWKPYRSSSAHNPDRPRPPMLGAGYSPLSWSSWRTWPNVKRPRVASTDRLALDEAQGLPTLVVYAQGSVRENEAHVLRYRSNTWIASLCRPGDRRTVFPTRTTSRTLPPGNGCSIPTPVMVPGRSRELGYCPHSESQRERPRRPDFHID